MKISTIQTEIFWEDQKKNLKHYQKILSNLAGKTDLVVLPEMFSTGFTMNSKLLAETKDGITMQTIEKWASSYQFAIAGSFIAKDENNQENIFNRGFFITPEGEKYFYDKRHLFRMGEENLSFKAGKEPLIIQYKGWNINLIICYDLRFPVWIRNVKNAYDLIICPANWPEARSNVWKTLLAARALENCCYVCGVNRIGTDGKNIHYIGESRVIDPKGKQLINAERKESIRTVEIKKEFLETFRSKFPVWKDADEFNIVN